MIELNTINAEDFLKAKISIEKASTPDPDEPVSVWHCGTDGCVVSTIQILPACTDIWIPRRPRAKLAAENERRINEAAE